MSLITGFIPLRAGSKAIKNKNRKKILGRPLYQWCLGEAIFSRLDVIYIFTDDDIIINQVEQEYKWTSKVKSLRRNSKNASDKASTEDAMLEFAAAINYDFDYICLLQATSLLTTRYDIDNIINKVVAEKNDSALSVVNTKRFLWNIHGESVNYNFQQRPRRQDFEGVLIENGAIYLSSKEQFLKSKNRLGGQIGIFEMPEDTIVEIDEKEDLILIEHLLRNRLSQLKGNPHKIKLLVLDVDGVFTNGKVAVSKDGEISKEFSLKDGMGLELIRENGVEVLVITSEMSEIVHARMKKLNIENIYLGIKDKHTLLKQILIDKDLTFSDIAYVGDDINDISNLIASGWGMCPRDSIDDVKQIADIVLNNMGGESAIREAVSFILKYNNRF